MTPSHRQVGPPSSPPPLSLSSSSTPRHIPSATNLPSAHLFRARKPRAFGSLHEIRRGGGGEGGRARANLAAMRIVRPGATATGGTGAGNNVGGGEEDEDLTSAGLSFNLRELRGPPVSASARSTPLRDPFPAPRSCSTWWRRLCYYQSPRGKHSRDPMPSQESLSPPPPPPPSSSRSSRASSARLNARAPTSELNSISIIARALHNPAGRATRRVARRGEGGGAC